MHGCRNSWSSAKLLFYEKLYITQTKRKFLRDILFFLENFDKQYPIRNGRIRYSVVVFVFSIEIDELSFNETFIVRNVATFQGS